jgi:hypothetical protein
MMFHGSRKICQRDADVEMLEAIGDAAGQELAQQILSISSWFRKKKVFREN